MRHTACPISRWCHMSNASELGILAFGVEKRLRFLAAGFKLHVGFVSVSELFSDDFNLGRSLLRQNTALVELKSKRLVIGHANYENVTIGSFEVRTGMPTVIEKLEISP